MVVQGISAPLGLWVFNGSNLPFVSVASGSTAFPFNASPAFQQSPFSTQATNIMGYAIDSIQIDYIHT
jgi:hypothetical protein